MTSSLASASRVRWIALLVPRPPGRDYSHLVRWRWQSSGTHARPRAARWSRRSDGVTAAITRYSCRLGSPALPPHQFPKLAEQISAVVRAGGRFGVVLDAEGGKAAVAD